MIGLPVRQVGEELLQ